MDDIRRYRRLADHPDESPCRRVARLARARVEHGLQVFGSQTSFLGELSQESRTNFFAVMEGEGIIGPAEPFETTMRSALPRESIRFGLMRLRVSSPSPMAKGSCDGEDFLKLRRDFLPVINAVGGNTQGQCSDG